MVVRAVAKLAMGTLAATEATATVSTAPNVPDWWRLVVAVLSPTDGEGGGSIGLKQIRSCRPDLG
jgi:hypothetical protein